MPGLKQARDSSFSGTVPKDVVDAKNVSGSKRDWTNSWKRSLSKATK